MIHASVTLPSKMDISNFLKTVAGAYLSCRSYSDHGKVSTLVAGSNTSHILEFTTRFERPTNLKMKWIKFGDKKWRMEQGIQINGEQITLCLYTQQNRNVRLS